MTAAAARTRSGDALPVAAGHAARPEILPLLGLAVVLTAAWWMQGVEALLPAELVPLLADAAVPGLLALALALLLAGGQIDLSLGALAGLAAAASARLQGSMGIDPAAAAASAILAAGLVGGLNGWLVGALRQPAWLVTLVTAAALHLLPDGLTGGLAVPDMVGSVGSLAAAGEVSPAVSLALGGREIVVPALSIATAGWIVAACVVPWLLRHTVGGNRVLALGAAAHAARMLGLAAGRTRVGLFLVAGALAGLAGVLGGVRGGIAATSSPFLLALLATALGGALATRSARVFLAVPLATLLVIAAADLLAELALPSYQGGLAAVAAALLALWIGRGRRVAAEGT
jgi:ribose/xylose/arabinose/galactoside ABC-type transport system permease subunit